MSQKTIELGGIVRNLPDNTVPDGSMQEIINLRPRDGAWRPIGVKVKVTSVPTNVIYIHQVSNTIKVYLGYLNTGYLAYWVYVSGTLVRTDTAYVNMSTGKSIQCVAIGSILLVANHTDKVNILLGYLFDTNQYENYGSGIPDLPVFDVTSVSKPVDHVHYTTESTKESRLAEGVRAVNENGSSETKGYATGKILVRFAWELTDGSIVKPSAPVMIELSWLSYSTSTEILFMPKELNINVTTATAALTALKNKYKGLIASLNIYTCRLQEMKEGVTPFFMPVQDPPSVEEEISYYKIASVPLSDIDGDKLVNKGFYAPFSDLIGKDTMPTDNFTHHNIYSKTLFVYNSRIFMGDVSTVLSNFPHAVNTFGNTMGAFTGASFDVALEFDLYTPSGTKTVFGGWRTIDYYAGVLFYPEWQEETNPQDPHYPGYFPDPYWVASTTPVLCAKDGIELGTTPAMIYYPDARAFQVKIYVRQSNVTYLVKTVLLKKHTILNFAFNTTDAQAQGPWNTYPVVSPVSNPVNTYNDSNRIQATELENPFSFPAKNSYRVQGKVLGLSTNAIALSQGQFGQFPVYCFTSEGIWTMSMGDGDILINTISPLLRHVCNNPDSITQIEGGVVFSTSKGLYILIGTEAVEISPPAEGSYLGRISGTLNYEAIANNPNLYQVKNFLCSISFLTYLAGAKIAWDHTEGKKEIIVSNHALKYSWVYNTIYKRWFKISQVFENFVQDYPYTYGYGTESVTYTKYLLSEEDYTDLIPVHMETRPLKISPSAFKKINRAVINGYIYNNMEFPFSVNLFGSPDKRNWFLLNASNTFSARSQLVIGRTTFSCYFYILVIGGKVDEEAYFTGVEVDSDDTYNNKLK